MDRRYSRIPPRAQRRITCVLRLTVWSSASSPTGLKRNAAVVLGNVGILDDVPVLEAALDDVEPLVREHAGWALERLRAPATITRQRTDKGYIPAMSPTVPRDGPFRLFFFWREVARMHVHVAHPDGEAKFWLEPTVALATAVGMPPGCLRRPKRSCDDTKRSSAMPRTRHFGR